jgi:hypothetical protein
MPVVGDRRLSLLVVLQQEFRIDRLKAKATADILVIFP